MIKVYNGRAKVAQLVVVASSGFQDWGSVGVETKRILGVFGGGTSPARDFDLVTGRCGWSILKISGLPLFFLNA